LGATSYLMESFSRPISFSTDKPRTATGAWFPAPFQVELRQEVLPELWPDDVRVRAIASAISHGTEMLVYRGQVPSMLDLDLPTLKGGFDFPIKYGYASVGRVVETGSSVESLRDGDLVFVHHPHQDEYVVPASMAVRLPSHVEEESALFVASLETALGLMHDAAPRLRERIVIFGQGVIGLLLTQLARHAGAGLIIVVDPIANRRQLARTLGADAAFSPDEAIVEAVRDLTDGVGADLVLEASGNGEALQQAIECAAFQSTVVVGSWYGTKPVTLCLGQSFHRGRVRLVSSQVSSIDPALQPRWNPARRLATVVSLLPILELSPLITHRIPFGSAAKAYDLVDRRPDDTIQVILVYEDNDV